MSLTKKAILPASIYDRLFVALLIGLALLVLFTFKDYGISVDEEVQKNYGHLLLAFYRSRLSDQRLFSYENLYLYGGLFDLVSAALMHVSPLTEYDTRHLLCAAIGLIGIVGVWRVGRLLAGPRVGLIAAALLAITGVYYGGMFNNTKDVPFAAGMIWVVYFACRLVGALPKPAYAITLGLGAAIGLSLGIRVGALFGIAYLLPVLLADLVARWRAEGWRGAVTAGGVLAWQLLPGVVLALALMAVLWPWSVLAPGNIFAAVHELSDFNFPTAIAGRIVNAQDIPAWYLPDYLLVKLPELVLAGLFLALAVTLGGLRALPAADWRMPSLAGQWSVVVLAAGLPVAYAVIAHPGLYNGLRHFLFVVPPLCVIAAFGLDRAFTTAARFGRFATLVVLALATGFAAKDIWTLIALHPHQYVYFNLLTGGVKGAAGRYEMDYWSNFAPEAIAQLVAQLKAENGGRLPDRKIPVAVTFRQWVLDAYAPSPIFESDDAWGPDDEFCIATTNSGSDNGCEGKVIIAVSRMGAALGVVKDLRPSHQAAEPPAGDVAPAAEP